MGSVHIDTITSKVVLILGRFTEERKKVLDALGDELRKRKPNSSHTCDLKPVELLVRYTRRDEIFLPGRECFLHVLIRS